MWHHVGLLCRATVADFTCRCEEAIVDLEAAQHVYIALGQQAKADTLEDDLAKIKQLWASIHTKHA